MDWIGWNWSSDGWVLAAGALSAVAAALLGNFLVLRRMSMLGDAISHAVLPGLAAAFLITGARTSLPMFIGAALVGLLTAVFTEWIRGFGKVDEGASMGVVFTSLFALGLVMIVQAADHVDLDPSCVLYGSLETVAVAVLIGDTWNVLGLDVPRTVGIAAINVLVNAAFLLLFYKELKISSFDPALATTAGYSARLMHYALMTLVAVTAVVSFESMGNILVVAMFVVPPAAAYLLTDRLRWMIVLSVLLAVGSAALGHLGSIALPQALGMDDPSIAASIAVAAGLLFVLAALFGPQHGWLVRFVRHRALARGILAEDVIAYLYRREERDPQAAVRLAELRSELLSGPVMTRVVLALQRLRGMIVRSGGGYRLTSLGREQAKGLVRSHRLWESYLASEAGVSADRIHQSAERLEHFTDRRLRARLDEETLTPVTDPHGRPIPEEGSSR
ncbi:MAG TPA: metal ABC transporter permease [Pirellulaceae bacterium]|jgi:manganese/zinc/iron transport system permease protein|nr:metal ABC transporter permease [Pirellulaceae bacterium]